MERGRAETPQGFEMLRRAVAFVLRKAVAWVFGVELFEALVAMRFREDRSCGDRDAARVAFDERFLFDEDIELHRIDEQVVGCDDELLESSGHGLAAGLIDIPGINARRIDFRDCPRNGMFADAKGEFAAALRRELLRIVQADDAALGIEDDGRRNDGAEEGAAAGFVESGDAGPAELARGSLKTGRTSASHRAKLRDNSPWEF